MRNVIDTHFEFVHSCPRPTAWCSARPDVLPRGRRAAGRVLPGGRPDRGGVPRSATGAPGPAMLLSRGLVHLVETSAGLDPAPRGQFCARRSRTSYSV
ncbi:hypothetical protein QJS66_22270 [Kocuria rhizophila]|nr:hypothetical protein QJS66_22270 [Kocuria rhizophila]